jgi:hypothetical protein
MAGINNAICIKSIGNHNNCVMGSLKLKKKIFIFIRQKYPNTHIHTIRKGFPARSLNISLNITILNRLFRKYTLIEVSICIKTTF